jgi:hypothetical protein
VITPEERELMLERRDARRGRSLPELPPVAQAFPAIALDVSPALDADGDPTDGLPAPLEP